MAETENNNEAMTVEAPEENSAEVSAETLMENLAKPDDAPEESAEQSEEQQEQSNPYAAGIQSLYDDGWEQGDVAALIADPQALRDIKGGKTVRQAAFAFMRRQNAAAKPAQSKKGVPTVRTTATTGTNKASRLAEMSDEEFAELSQKARAAMMEGKKVTFDSTAK